MGKKTDSLVGKYFHTTDDEHQIDRQGQIVELVAEKAGAKLYRCQLFSWVTGCPTIQFLAPPESMALTWRFYDSAEDWRRAGDSVFRRQEEGSLILLSRRCLDEEAREKSRLARPGKKSAGKVSTRPRQSKGKRKTGRIQHYV